ncbi:MAG: efflux RND transporter periplasmic adaptor subunit [Candidatus Paceibacterota bacterium]|jgi:RND family efflux transporter MFP subunit|nr:efflux RND transporter periplasmic adaptor subunit [bacterium]
MNILNNLKNHKIVMLVLIVLVTVSSIGLSYFKNSETVEVATTDKKVSLIPVSEYTKGRNTISANGAIESLEQAELRSQVMAPVARINTSVGSNVNRGQILVVLQNNDLTAQLNQAKASLKAQQARLEEMKKGTRSEELKVTETQLEAARINLENTKKQQEITIENARKNLFNSNITAVPSIGTIASTTPTITGTYNGTEDGKYTVKIYITGDGAMFQAEGLENATGLVNTIAQPLGKKGLYIQFPSQGINNGTWTINIPNTQAASYNANKNAYEAALQTKQTAIDAANSAYETAKSAYELKQAGSSLDQIKAQEAAVEQAQASVEAINAQLQKTIITSPISGTVSAVSVKYGELLTVGQSIVSIVNKSGLQVKAYISESDLTSIEEGASVTITDKVKGVVSKISPSIDSKTKNVEVDILIIDPEKSELVVGQNVSVKIDTKNQLVQGSTYSLPLQSVGTASDYYFIYIIDSDSKLEEVRVTVGAINGENIEILTGLTSDMKIVSTVYELKKGQKVIVQ